MKDVFSDNVGWVGRRICTLTRGCCKGLGTLRIALGDVILEIGSSFLTGSAKDCSGVIEHLLGGQKVLGCSPGISI